MARIFITGSTDGLGRAAARSLLRDGHEVVLHARTAERAAALTDIAPGAAAVAVGDLGSSDETRSIADQVNAVGRMDAVIHNAGIYDAPSRGATPEGHSATLAVNVLAPFVLTALIHRPDRLVYLSSGLHRGGGGPLRKGRSPRSIHRKERAHSLLEEWLLGWAAPHRNRLTHEWRSVEERLPGVPLIAETDLRCN